MRDRELKREKYRKRKLVNAEFINDLSIVRNSSGVCVCACIGERDINRKRQRAHRHSMI